MTNDNFVAYGDYLSEPFKLANVPSEFRLKLELTYPNGNLLVLIYSEEPKDLDLRQRMWQLQRASYDLGFRITIHHPDGRVNDASPLSPDTISPFVLN